MRGRRRTRVGSALGVAVALVLAACGGGDGGDGEGTAAPSETTAAAGAPAAAGGASSALSGTVKIGVPLDTSGSAAIAGVGGAELAGVRLAADEINESGFLGGDAELELVVADTKADKQEAVAKTVELIQRDDVDAIVGYTLTPSFLAAGPQAQQAGVPVMTVGLSAVGVTDVGDYVFRIYPDLTRLFENSDPKFVEALGAKSAAYLYGNDTETTVGQFEFRKKLIEGLGLRTASVQTVTAQDTDVRAQLTEIKNADPDVWLLNVNTGQQPGILLQAQEIGLLPQATAVVGDVGFGNATVLQQASDVLQCGLFATTWTLESETGKNRHFVDLYRQKNGGKDPDAFVAWGYDAVWAVATAMKDAGTTDKEAVRDALGRIESFEGALGTYGFDEGRQPTQEGILMQVRDGKPVPWTPDAACQK